MKKIIFSLIALAGFTFVASAQTAAPVQQPRPQFARAIFDVPTMTTEAQFLAIKPVLEKTAGIRFTNVMPSVHQVVFSYDPSVINAAKIAEILVQSGYANVLSLSTESGKPSTMR